jgi:hypothetical protein
MILPKNWSVGKIQQEFKASDEMVQTALKLVAEKGILLNENIKPNKILLPAKIKWCSSFM